ncbi:Cell cycle checkpoint protein RAD17 [Gracilariopsis chorda]|uniref:Cell cycle checkpoint protein RAD17 n=1 Tax=Gracilariopsis chorda TaxID=448386 RepID=A0A2V3J4X3_9FLOR|nr:Cell cycle checkpoint protein RAD17 [Gracilariopsis chorda]|eukprot:PXF49445.1 Cell cycle checkpoint protein RAD17 [Gracilariopsis chorda]
MVLSTRKKRQRFNSKNTKQQRPDPIEAAEGFEAKENDHSSDSSHFRDTPPQSVLLCSPEVSLDSPPNAPAWIDRYSDIHAQTGLAVSKKKFNEIMDWLSLALEHAAPRLLVLSGPPGCGKGSAVRAACEKLECKMVSWDAPLTGSLGISTTLIEDFQSFVIGTRYRSLVTEPEEAQDMHEYKATYSAKGNANERRLLLIDDLPLHLTDLRTHKETIQQLFWNIARYAPYPTILLLSENENGIHRLSKLILGQSLLQSEWVGTLAVPPVTTTMMKKRLQELLSIENITVPREQLERIVSSSNGDIRSALNILHLFTTGDGQVQPTESRTHRKRKRPRVSKKKENLQLEFDRDVALSTYHAVSKILNNKRGESGQSRYVAEEILDEARTDPTTFVSFLHQNYPEFFGDCDDVVPTLTCLSEADTLLPWRQEQDLRVDLRECAASIVTRGFLYFNTQPRRSGWRPIRGPESQKTAKESRSHVQYSKMAFKGCIHPSISTRSELCETLPYAKKIGELSMSRCARFAPNAATNRDYAYSDAKMGVNARGADLMANGGQSLGVSIEAEEVEDSTDPIEEWEADDWQ